jgi:hypothetical protein
MTAATFKQAIKRSLQRVIRRPQAATQPAPVFSIGIYAGDSPLSLRPAANARNPVLTSKSVSDVPALYVADPFMIKSSEGWYMFLEVLNKETGRGEIGLATSADALNWQYEEIVLREPFHLSYPYVFEWEHQYYMVPESYQARSVRLYRAIDFPMTWSFTGELISGDEFVDSSLFRFHDRWWLLNDVARPPYYAGTLRLFYSDRLNSTWREHPQSPLIDGNAHIARPGGRVSLWNGRVVRFTQDCCPAYGLRVRAFELTDLTTTSFSEQELDPSPVLEAGAQKWNEAGMHHIDPHLNADGRWIACVDGWHWDS